MFPIKIKLQYPIQNGSETIESIEISRRLKVKDLMSTDNLEPTAHNAKLIGNLTGLPPNIIEEMDASDYKDVAKVLDSFLSPSPESGKEV